jgi:putative transposase
MPRHRRYLITGYPFHLTNRGVERRRLFFDDADYDGFLRLAIAGKGRFSVSVFGICLMPNHFHLVARPDADGALSAYLQWVQGNYARDLRAHSHTVGHGHVFQQRFWSGPITDEMHLINVLRYVEANPVTASLVDRAENWRWGSLRLRSGQPSALLDPLPVALPAHWLECVNTPALLEDPD